MNAHGQELATACASARENTQDLQTCVVVVVQETYAQVAYPQPSGDPVSS